MRRPPHQAPPAGVDACFALLSYVGVARELVARLKYRNARASVGWLAAGMAALVDEPVHVVTFVPTTTVRRRDRGFDQAALLAQQVGRNLAVPASAVLRRGAVAAQTGADAATRRHRDPRIEARRHIGGTVLLVDDVVTTGATLSAAAHALRAAGASRVIGLVAARTPAPGDLH
jgi:predicted amidophosphoribosyltransferase